MDGGPVDRVMGSSAGAAERARRETALDLANRLAEAEGEEREDALDFAAYQMGRLVGHGFDLSDASTMLFGGARACGLVDDVGVDAVQATVARAIEDGQLAAIEEIREAEVRRRGGGGEQQAEPAPPPPIELHDGDDDEAIMTRQWVLGTTFARGYVSGLIAPGAAGKTALRTAQLMAVATGKPLTGETVHASVPVLQVSLEDDEIEGKRRMRACRLHHGIAAGELQGRFFRVALANSSAKLVARGEDGRMALSPLAQQIAAIVRQHGIGVVSFDPLVKVHDADENSNNAMDEVMRALVAFAGEMNVAVDVVHHARKGPVEAGDADIGRGASATRDAMRLAKTLTRMSKDEAVECSVPETQRWAYVRYDDAKVNLAPADTSTRWFRLVGVNLGNATQDYPNGDSVQTVATYRPPNAFDGVGNVLANEILTAIEAGPGDGERYTDYPKGKRQAWEVVQRMVPDKSEAEAKTIIRTWLKSGVLRRDKYTSPGRREEATGLFVVAARRPS